MHETEQNYELVKAAVVIVMGGMNRPSKVFTWAAVEEGLVETRWFFCESWWCGRARKIESFGGRRPRLNKEYLHLN